MKVALVGGSPSWKDAPFEDKDYEIWVLGNQIDRYKNKRITRIFEIHNDLTHHQEGYEQYLVSLNVDLVVDQFPIKAEHIIQYPFEDVPLKTKDGNPYLTSSPAYMFALAVTEGFSHIELYGIDMAVDDHEYFMQRPCMEAWMGYALGREINVITHDTCPLMNANYLEGRDWHFNRAFHEDEYKTLAKEHTEKMADIDQQISLLQINHATHNGARQVYERLSKVERAKQSGQDVSLTDTVVIK